MTTTTKCRCGHVSSQHSPEFKGRCYTCFEKCHGFSALDGEIHK